MSAPWWAVFPPAQSRLRCGAGDHRLRWAEGKLTSLDHDDPEGELVLAALGGDRPACVDLLEAWGRHAADLEVLALGPRSAADTVPITARDLARLRPPQGGGWFAYAPLTGQARARARLVRSTPLRPLPTARVTAARAGGPAPHPARARRPMPRRMPMIGGLGGGPELAREAELLTLLALGPAFQFRLSATVAAAHVPDGRPDQPNSARPALTAAMAGRLAPAAADWLGTDPDRVDVGLHEGSGWGSVTADGTGPERSLRAQLPVGWLASVWAAGLSVVAGHLVVEVREAAWPRAEVLALPAPDAEPVVLSLRDRRRHWSHRVARWAVDD
jgi:hypothetical protein